MNFEMWGLSGSLATEREDQMADAVERLWARLESVRRCVQSLPRRL